MSATRPPLFDANAAATARLRADAAAGDRFLDAAAAEGLADRLAAVTRKFTRGLLIGPASGREQTDKTVPPDIAPFAKDWTCINFDANEILVTTEQDFDVAVSLFSLQTINDLPGALVQIRHALKPDGLFVAAILGGATLSELRDAFAHAESVTRGGASPRVSPFADVRDMGALLQRAGFALPVADVERLLVRYGDFFALARDLRSHGFTNVLSERSRSFLRRDTLAALLAHYAAHHADSDGKLRARFETVYLTGWSPHDSQQKPLAPGSAKSRLADALGVPEQIISGSTKPG
jgi:SAM-dependent methyltransferase